MRYPSQIMTSPAARLLSLALLPCTLHLAPAAATVAAESGKADAWAFQPASRPVVPSVPQSPSPIRHPIDAFILARLRDQNLSPSPEADRNTLLRRLTFDLTGLPPTSEEVEAFRAD